MRPALVIATRGQNAGALHVASAHAHSVLVHSFAVESSRGRTRSQRDCSTAKAKVMRGTA
eukprot:175406-Prymnesium_polylepis.2